MDRVLNPKDEKQTIYEIYRACRLCGAGAGYKMPIIQNVVELDGDGIELRQKIKECVQIEVNHTDRMPPLICELCVDKVNDFYLFLDMCKQNNKRTRQRLGLPLQTPTRDSADSENCILGVTEPVFIDSDAEIRNKNRSKKTKVKKETVEVKIKTESRPSPVPVSAPVSRDSSEPRWTVLSRAKPSPRPEPRRLTEPQKPTEPRRATRQSLEPVLTPAADMLVLLEKKLKRSRETTQIETPPPAKKTKSIPEPLKIPVSKSKIQKEPLKVQKEPPKTPKPQPKPLKNIRKSPPPPKITSKSPPSKALPKVNSKLHANNSKPKVKASPVVFTCLICNVQTKTSGGLFHHQLFKHIPAFTSHKNACNACELWFPTTEEAVAHHKNHRAQNVPYKCTRCYGYFKLQQEYEDHFGEGQCLSEWEVPDAACPTCWRAFPTTRLLEQHRCAGADGRPGGKCVKCKRSYALLKNLMKHESTCTHNKDKGDTKDPEGLRAGLLPMQVVIARCDPLLASGAPLYCGALPQNYGLDPSRHYPYLRARIKTEPPMVAIDESIKQEFTSKVDTLSALCLRIIQAKKLKDEPEFEDISAKIDSIIDHLENEDTISAKIDNIIDHLANDDTQTSCGSDSILNKDATCESSENDVDSKTKDDESYSILNKKDTNCESSENDVDSKTKYDESYSILNKKDANFESSVKDVDSNTEDDYSDDKKDTAEAMEDDADETKETQVNCVIRENGEDKNINSSRDTEYTEGFDALEAESVKEKESVVEREKESNIGNVSDGNVSEISNHDNTDHLNNDICTVSENHSNVTSNDNLEDSLKHDNITYSLADRTDEITRTENEQSNVEIENNKELERTENSPTDDISSKNDNVDSIEISKNANELNYHEEQEEMEFDENKDSNNENDTSLYKSENNENFSKIDEITNKILADTEKVCDSEVKSDPNSDSRPSKNGVDNQDKFNVNDLSEDDRKLMAELDEQIGEHNQISDQKICENVQRDGDGQRISENIQRDSDDGQRSETDQRINDNDQGVSENDHRINDCDQRITENDQRAPGFYQNTSENEQKNDKDQSMTENDRKVNESQKSRNHYIDELIKKQDPAMRSLDLDNISDDEFNFDI